MALIVKDRVKESTTTTGTADFVLGGAAAGFQTFAVIGNTNTTYYAAVDQATGDWEVGIGTYSSTGPTLTRDTVFESSNSGSKVNFAAGSKDVFCTYPAERSVYLDAPGSAVSVLDIGTLGASTANITTANITAGTVTTTPASGNDLVNKSYVDTLVASGIHFHDPVRVESPINLNATYNNGTAGVGATLTNAGTQAALVIDGITMVVADRVLVYEQTNQTQNGVYVVTNVGSGSTNWVLTRSTDADTYGIAGPNTLSEGSTFFVQEGATGAGETYTCSTVGTITFGTTNITFAQISSAQIYSAGTGLTLSGTQFSITNTGTAGTYGSASSVPVFVTNAQGQVTSVAPTAIAIAAAAVSGLAASATTDTTNAANITSGTLPSARLNGSYTGITGVGTLAAGTWNANTIAAIYGGTGLTSYVQGDLLYATSSTTVGRLADEVAGNALISGGVGGDPAWGKIGLGTHVSGTLPVGNGGTGATTLTGYVFGNGTGAFTASTSIPNSATTATNANTANAIVARDASGNFSAGTITAALNGNASTATTAANVNNGTLSMAVSGTGLSGSATFTANQSGNSTFTVTSNATNANTGSTIVARDASGNFSAGTVTAALSGNATTATTLQTARNIGGVSFNGSADINLPGVNTAGNQNTSGTAANVTGTVAIANGGTGATTNTAARTNLGATTLGGNLFTLANVAAIAFPRFNADNTVSSLDAASFRTAIGAGTSSTTGTVTSVSGTGTASGLSLSGTVTTSGSLTLSGTVNSLAAGTYGISISGNAATATNISNTGTVTLATATESNAITITQPSYTNDTPVKLLNFDWYGNTFSLGNIRSGGTPSSGFGVYYTASGGARTEIARFGTGGSFNAVGAITQNGSQVLTAGNYTSYSPSLTGSGASGTWGINVTGNAATATTLQTGRTVAITGDLTYTSGAFNGSANVTGTGTLANSGVSAGSYTLASITVDAKGRVTAASNGTAPSGFVAGMILLWSGSIASIPSGWVLCNGLSSTPDLRDRFVVGAGSTYAVNATGGAASVTLGVGNLPSHTHNFSVSGTSGNAAGTTTGSISTDFVANFGCISNVPNATGVFGTNTPRGNRAQGAAGTGSNTNLTINIANHTHTFSASGTTDGTGSGTAFAVLPPYYALAYIMKT